MQLQSPKKASLDAESTAQDWHPADIKAALEKQGWTLTLLAEHYQLATGTGFSKAFITSAPIYEQRIADAIGVHPKEIWPSRYYPDGSQKPRGYRRLHSSAKRKPRNVKDQKEINHDVA